MTQKIMMLAHSLSLYAYEFGVCIEALIFEAIGRVKGDAGQSKEWMQNIDTLSPMEHYNEMLHIKNKHKHPCRVLI